jgi:tripartite-type tricarboxylate transporter receptor subunit TctC
MKTWNCITRLALAAAMLALLPAQAQDYPIRPVRMIVPLAAGGGMDTITRGLAQRLGDTFGQSFVVDNRPGAGSLIGLEILANAAPDGYTLMMISATTVVYPILYKSRFDMLRDFTPVSQVSAQGYVLVVHPAIPAKSVAELVEHARANPGKLNYGTSGPGSVSHLGAELFKSLTKANVVEVPYKGSILAIQDLLGGQIQFIFSDALPALSHIRGGKLRALAVTSPERSALVPDLPTCVEAGVPGLVAVNWWGVLMPAGTPKPIIDKFHGDLVKTMADPEVKRKFGDLGVDAISSSPEQFASFIKSETAKYEKLIKEAGIKAQ